MPTNRKPATTGRKTTTTRKRAARSKPADPKVLAALSAIAGRQRMAQRLGMGGVQFGGDRDIYTAAGYPKAVTFEHYWALYTRGDIAGRIVDMPAKTTWRTPPEVVIEKKEEGTKFTNDFYKLAKRLKLWSYFQRVDRLAGVGRYAVLFIGTRGADDQTLKTPLTRLAGPQDILYLAIYNEENAKITDWETDPSNPRFGLPRTYTLTTTNNSSFRGTSGTSKTDLIVHASRCIHVAEDMLEDEVFGRPRLERCLNRLFDLEKVAASTGEAYWQLVARILQAKIDPNMEVSDPDLAELDEKLGELSHDLRRQFFGQGVSLEWLTSETPNVTEVADFYFSLVSGASGIPKRILFGSEMGELASTTDQETYLGTINERQESFAEPIILRAFIDRLVELGGLPKPEGEDGEYQVNWPPLFEESWKDKAEVNNKLALTAQALTPVGGNPRELIRIDANGDLSLVEREPDEPMELPPVDPAPPGDEQRAQLEQQISELEESGEDPEKLRQLKDELAALDDDDDQPAPPETKPPEPVEGE